MALRSTLAAALILGGAATAPALACQYDGVRGYHNPRGNECRSAYRFTANEVNGNITFQSDGRRWFWSLAGQGDDLSYRLTGLNPPSQSGLSGQMYPAPGDPVIRGDINSGYCGSGYITLTRIPGTCRDARPNPPVQPPTTVGRPGQDPGVGLGTQGGVLPVSGRSLGGIVRSGPSLNARRVTSLRENQRITIVQDTGVRMNDFNWFRVRWHGGEGYQWGGIMCADTEMSWIFVCRN